MKKSLFVLTLVIAAFVFGRFSSPAVAWIPEMYTDGIGTAGVVKVISMHILSCEQINNETACTWHYFGTDPEVKPPPSYDPGWPIEEYAAIQFPSDLSYLGPDADWLLYDLARIVAGQIAGFE